MITFVPLPSGNRKNSFESVVIPYADLTLEPADYLNASRADSEETLSADDLNTSRADSEDTLSDDELDATIPYTYDLGYRIGWGPLNPSDAESSESEIEQDDVELHTHKIVGETELAPLSTCYVEEEEEEEGEEEELSGGFHPKVADIEQPRVTL